MRGIFYAGSIHSILGTEAGKLKNLAII
ncbi:uncharacterized protein METZ01_LOCUS422400 [marine metagenome]|uniref:Uncharacterized protein n=1 Tax=marine metagenome TaxID=408172 RepID=A0A382XEE7_9ZZZZ